MAKKGKFSQPRTHSFENAAPQQAPRPAADQPQPQNRPNPVVYNTEDLEIDYLPQIQQELPEEIPQPKETSFVDTLLAFFTNNRKVITVCLCALALVLIAGFIGIFFFSSASDPYDGKILNNVTVAGVNIGGMTRNEAINRLHSATDLTYTQQDMVIELPDATLRLSPGDTGAKLDVKAAVKAAFDYGRTGTKAEREAAYNASLTGNHTVGLLPYLSLNQDYIRDALKEYASQFGSLFTEATYEFEGEMPPLEVDRFDETTPCQTLLIKMGTPGVSFDIEAIFNDVLDAYSLNRFLVKVDDVEADAVPDIPDVEAIHQEVSIEPVDSFIDMQTYQAVPGSYGYTFDLEAAQRQVDRAAFGDVIRIAMEYVAPEILDEDVFFRDVLGSCETPHTKNEDRNTNLRLACETLNGLVLMPGEEFSFNNALGERTAAKGYKPAPAYSGIHTINSIGGGICQISSTLYYCTLLADLEIVFRINHGFVSSYIDYGMDATVSWGYPDFKFKNSTNYPIKITAEVSDGYVRMQILGTDEKDYYVKMSYLVSNEYPYEVIYEEYPADNPEGYTDGQVLQDGVTGYFVRTYKSKYNKETNELISKDFEASSTYKTVDKIIVKIVGNEPTEETIPPTTPGEEVPGGDPSGGDPSGGETTGGETTGGEGSGGEISGGEAPAGEASGSEVPADVSSGGDAA